MYCTRYKKYTEFQQLKIYICDKILLFFSICDKCRSGYEKYLTKKNQLKH